MPVRQTALRRLLVSALVLSSAVGVSITSPAVAQSATPDDGVTAGKPSSGKPALGNTWSPTAGKTKANSRTGVVPGSILVTLGGDTSLTGTAVHGTSSRTRTAHTSDAALNARLRSVGASSFTPLFSDLSTGTVQSLTDAARSRLQGSAVDLSRTYVVKVSEHDSTKAADTVAHGTGVAYAAPQRYMATMDTGAQPLAKSTVSAAAADAKSLTAPSSGSSADPSLPSNYGLASSAQAYLNAGGLDTTGAYSLLGSSYGQLPGKGETITNVSVGDLTDQGMADAGDSYVQNYGPTTVLQGGQRYLDMPSMPLIPTYVAAPNGSLDPTGSTENQDPGLGEVLLDFGVMSPLPHDQQRAGNTGSGYTDLLGIAPGANYRLVVPQQPTDDQIAGALLAAARQVPRPDVITASLGFGTDYQGFPSRYLEDDPLDASVIAAIVQKYHIVVSVSSNDGTRLATPTSVGPDGGSTPTDTVADQHATTTINDDSFSTTPSKVVDSGAIAAGGTTLDDTLAQPVGSSGPLAGKGTLAETRISGGGSFSSGFGSRVDLSAPSDNILVYQHTLGGSAQSVSSVLNGGTSASAPEIAAAAAVVLQAGKLGGHQLTPAAVRSLLEKTGRAVPTPPQIDQPLHVGPQVDVTAAVTAALGGHSVKSYQIKRLSVAHRVTIGSMGGTFLEESDPTRIDLGDVADGGNGEGLVGPVTFGADIVGPAGGKTPDYVLTVSDTDGKGNSEEFHSSTPAVRLTPRQLLSAAGLGLSADSDQQVTVSFQIRVNGKVQAATSRVMTIGPSDGTYTEATAPVVDPVVKAGQPVTVHYNLSGVIGTKNPKLVVSTVGHWSPALGPVFSASASFPLTEQSGTVTIPADAFSSGGGLYGIGIAQATSGTDLSHAAYGEFAPVRVDGSTASERPAAPTMAAGDGAYGHTVHVTGVSPAFSVDYDVRNVSGASSAMVEISAPGPTLYGSYNTFTNANGTSVDNDGIDTGSVVHRAFTGTHGTVRLDAAALGLSTSMSYNVRVLGTDGQGAVVGQASPSSQLAFDDGLAPDGSTVTGFAIAGKDSIATLRTASGGTEVRPYSTATGTYGAVLTSDPDTSSAYQVFGTVPAKNRVLLAHLTANGDTRLETYDTSTGTLVGSATITADTYQVVAGRVDQNRDRGAVLLHATGSGTDTVLPVDLATGTAGTALPADPAGVKAGTYTMLDIDASSGDVFLAKYSADAICLLASNRAQVDLDTGEVTGSGPVGGCTKSLVAGTDGTLYSLVTRSVSANIQPTTSIATMDSASLEVGAATALGRGNGMAMAVDTVHHVAVVAYKAPPGTAMFGAPNGVITDNNVTSQVLVIDLTTGATLKTLNGFDFASGFGGDTDPDQQPGIQLDPNTRTAWTYSPYGAQIQSFAY